ncbi:MAG TPA: hypothetical protein VJC02_01125 [Candidatus Paceibacterota bacterium]
MRKNPIVYITKDKERAEGLEESSDYFIISGNGERDTLTLLNDKDVQKKIKDTNAEILVFKNTVQIEEVVKKNKFKLLNPSATLAEKIENKISQASWLHELSYLLPPHEIVLVKNLKENQIKSIPKKKPFILQWAHSHTGDGTLYIENEKRIRDLKDKFGEREAKISEYIRGPVFTVNIVVAKNSILIGNISYQITGISPFTENIFSTIGNDWSLPHTILTEKNIEEIKKIANLIGEKMKKSGWKGLFGIDVIHDEERDKIFLIEINARQPASTTFESVLQDKIRTDGIPGITIFEAHISALRDSPLENSLIEINDGAQIVQRVTKEKNKLDPEKLVDLGYKVLIYKNIKINSDLARIQSTKGIMEAHNKFNNRGKEIKEKI